MSTFGEGATEATLLVAAQPLEALTNDHERKGETEESVVVILLGAQKQGQVY